MAHFRRRYPRHRTPSRAIGSLSSWPASWDVCFHRRPKRRHNKALLHKVLQGYLDFEDVAWPLGNHKPHHYYW